MVTFLKLLVLSLKIKRTRISICNVELLKRTLPCDLRSGSRQMKMTYLILVGNLVGYGKQCTSQATTVFLHIGNLGWMVVDLVGHMDAHGI